MRVLLFVLCLFASLTASAENVYERTHPVTLRIELDADSYCSATAVGPHTLLTAAHCLQGEPVRIDVDGKVVDVESVVMDGADHALIRVDATFPTWARVRQSSLVVGEDVFLVGNPDGLVSVLRKGYYAGSVDMNGPSLLFGMITSGGDSGAGVFDAAGLLITSHTGGIITNTGFRLARSHPLAFTREQWAEASR